jgi:hypothetical protein
MLSKGLPPSTVDLNPLSCTVDKLSRQAGHAGHTAGGVMGRQWWGGDKLSGGDSAIFLISWKHVWVQLGISTGLLFPIRRLTLTKALLAVRPPQFKPDIYIFLHHASFWPPSSTST